MNEKFVPEYEISNWAAFLASSNSPRALHMAANDRRWFVPEVTDQKKPLRWWTDFNHWLAGPGLPRILNWAIEYLASDPSHEILPGSPAPMSVRKAELIEDSLSEGQQLVRGLGELAMQGDGERIILVDKDVQEWLAEKLGVDRTYPKLETLETIRSALKAAGMKGQPKARFKIDGARRKVMANFDLPEDADWQALKKFRKSPKALSPVGF